jgi:hypothetical protein
VDRRQFGSPIFLFAGDHGADVRHLFRKFVPLLVKLAGRPQFGQHVLNADPDLCLRLARLALEDLHMFVVHLLGLDLVVRSMQPRFQSLLLALPILHHAIEELQSRLLILCFLLDGGSGVAQLLLELNDRLRHILRG